MFPNSCNRQFRVLASPDSQICVQVASKRLQNAKSDKYHDNIHKRGNVTPTAKVKLL